MSIKKQLTTLFVCLLSASFFLGCEQVNNNPNQETTQENQKSNNKTATAITGKPSAPIQFTHNYDGLTQAGELELINLNFTSGLDGELLVSVNSKDKITTGGDVTFIQNVNANEVITIPMTIFLANEGKYYLNINTQLTTNSGTQGKSFALAVSTPSTKNTAQETTKSEKSKNNIIVMEAEENIKQD